jgi:hypothetical protein
MKPMKADEYGTILLEWGRPEALLARTGLSPRPPEPGAVESVPDLTVEDLTLVGPDDDESPDAEAIIICDDAESVGDAPPERTEVRRTGPRPQDEEPVDGGGWRGRFFVPVSLGTKPIWEARRLRS